jgi:phage terminase large subunit-like protein
MLSRKQEWQKQLAEFFIYANERQFIWGEFDCVFFALDAIRAISGYNELEKYRNTYHDKKTAIAMLRRDWENSADNVFNYVLGESSGIMNKAKRGDIIKCNFEKVGAAYGVVSLNGTHGVFKNQMGLSYHKLNKCECFWSV